MSVLPHKLSLFDKIPPRNRVFSAELRPNFEDEEQIDQIDVNFAALVSEIHFIWSITKLFEFSFG